ncbi:kinesin-like protein KIF20B [Cydia strobilella]|uniref:kinesin-like protein KIF20B n=1 Tax=Cydia strobilella TaxID=1100964 RepID=UPI0030071225
MIPTRFVLGQAPRKSRMEGRQSFLPRRLGSTDRLSDSRRPSATGPRSNSAEPGRASVAVSRHSREASATKLPVNRRSRSQQGDSRYGQPATTPLRNNQYLRPTTTPVRTPSGDRSRGWEASLDRALACVTVKDQRPIANIAWQRAELARVQTALAARGDSGATLIRPLTIARFVDVAGALLANITGDDKLNNDNYVTKLPHMCKRLLYPGTVSKSWLKAVNTLHAFPQALALIAYLLDLLRRIETPVSDEWLYVDNDELSQLRREYLRKCFIRFQTPDPQFDDIEEEHLQQLKQLLGVDDEKIRELQDAIKQQEQALSEEMESSACARASEASRVARRDALVQALRASRMNVQNSRAMLDAAKSEARDKANEIKAVDVEITRATAETAQLRKELESQSMSVEERGRLLDEVDYAARVYESKRVLADQIAKMVHNRETELALWQKKTLDSCVEYKQGLIHLSAQFPQLVALAIDETKLMEPSSLSAASSALEALKQLSSQLAQRRAQLARTRSNLVMQRQAKLEEARVAIADLKTKILAAEQAREADTTAGAAEEAAADEYEAEATAKLQAYKEKDEEFRKIHEELVFWTKQDEAWKAKLSAMHEYIRSLKENMPTMLQEAYKKRAELVAESLAQWKNTAGLPE